MGSCSTRSATAPASDRVETIAADARTFDLGTRFEHVIAPAAFVEL